MITQSEQNKKIGILDKGKNTSVLNSSFTNLDVGIQSEGEGLESRDNSFVHGKDNRWWEKSLVQVLFVVASICTVVSMAIALF